VKEAGASYQHPSTSHHITSHHFYTITPSAHTRERLTRRAGGQARRLFRRESGPRLDFGLDGGHGFISIFFCCHMLLVCATVRRIRIGRVSRSDSLRPTQRCFSNFWALLLLSSSSHSAWLCWNCNDGDEYIEVGWSDLVCFAAGSMVSSTGMTERMMHHVWSIAGLIWWNSQ